MMTGLPCTAVRLSAAPAKNEERAQEMVLGAPCLAQGDEQINALAEIYRLAGEQNLELRDELDHGLDERSKFEQRVVIVVGSRLGRRIVSCEPSGRSISNRQSGRADPIEEKRSACAIEGGSGKKSGDCLAEALRRGFEATRS